MRLVALKLVWSQRKSFTALSPFAVNRNLTYRFGQSFAGQQQPCRNMHGGAGRGKSRSILSDPLSRSRHVYFKVTNGQRSRGEENSPYMQPAVNYRPKLPFLDPVRVSLSLHSLSSLPLTQSTVNYGLCMPVAHRSSLLLKSVNLRFHFSLSLFL